MTNHNEINFNNNHDNQLNDISNNKLNNINNEDNNEIKAITVNLRIKPTFEPEILTIEDNQV